MNASSPTRQTLTIDEAAERIGISKSLAYRLVQKDEFPVKTIRVGRRLFVLRSAIDRFLEAESA